MAGGAGVAAAAAGAGGGMAGAMGAGGSGRALTVSGATAVGAGRVSGGTIGFVLAIAGRAGRAVAPGEDTADGAARTAGGGGGADGVMSAAPEPCGCERRTRVSVTSPAAFAARTPINTHSQARELVAKNGRRRTLAEAATPRAFSSSARLSAS